MSRRLIVLHRGAVGVLLLCLASGPATLPAPRGGGDLIGKSFDATALGRRIRVDGSDAAPPTRGHAVLYRWWTDGCPFCAATLPAVETLRKMYAAQGLEVVAVYHPKPPRPVSGDFVRAAASKLGYHGTIATDEKWQALRRNWLDTGNRQATSVSFLVDSSGVIRFVHPGTEFFPSKDAECARQDEDYHAVEAAIVAVLGERRQQRRD